jgi:hypothetical protein
MDQGTCHMRAETDRMAATHAITRAPDEAMGILAGLHTVFPELSTGHVFSGEGYAFVNDIEVVLSCDSAMFVEERVAALCCVAGAHDARIDSVTNPEMAVTVWWARFEVGGRGVRVQATACAVHDGPASLGTGHATPEQVTLDMLAGFVRNVGPIMRAHGLT